MINNEFDKEIKYKLFRTVNEILHPTISKKNISDYKIIIEEDILPVRVFYPKKVSNLSQVLIYIHGNGKVTDCQEKYSDICKELTLQTNSLMIAIEYTEEDYAIMYEKIYHTVKYLYERLERDNIESRNIILVGDSTGANIVMGINELNQKEVPIQKEILFYPVLNSDYSNKEKYESFVANEHFNVYLLENIQNYFMQIASNSNEESKLLDVFSHTREIPDMLILVGKVDSLKDEIEEYQKCHKTKVEYVELPFASHGFLKKMDEELSLEVFSKINEFIKK